MSERRPAWHRSVFARLVVIMLVMAASLLLLVAGFYFAFVIPSTDASADRLVRTHARAFAESRPDLETARRFAQSLGLEIRYVGAQDGWATDDGMPTLDQIERMRRSSFAAHLHAMLWPPSRSYYVAETPHGSYIFARQLSERLRNAHTRMLLVVLVIMIAVFVSAYLVLKRALRPLRLLDAGVRQMGEGQLDVVVPKQTHDEFGVLTDAFNRMARRVRDMVRARDQLLQDVSHELRSPLTRMKVALEMLPEGERKRAMAADVAEMEHMVTQLLELHRASGEAGLRRERTDLVALVRDVVSREAARPPGVRVTEAPDTVFVNADVEGMRTVLRNLVDNALKFSLPDSRAVEVTVKGENHAAVIRVRDDGAGVRAEDVERIFEPFSRPDPSRSKKTGGYGLGLSICKRIVDAHGGSIRVETHDGRGATFVVTLPRASSV